jgi:transcriptional regulator with XRE-family HTH domain
MMFNLSNTTHTTTGGSAGASRASFLFVGTFLLALSAGSPGTASSYPMLQVPVERTGSSPSGRLQNSHELSTAASVHEIRRLSGLRWEELAALFGVSRRSVHHWASGKVVSSANEDLIRQVLVLVRAYNRGEARKTRDFLLSPGAGGLSPFDHIRARSFEQLAAVPSLATPAVARSLEPLSDKARTTLRPPPPHALLDTINDGRPVVPTKARLARVRRVPKATDG